MIKESFYRSLLTEQHKLKESCLHFFSLHFDGFNKLKGLSSSLSERNIWKTWLVATKAMNKDFLPPKTPTRVWFSKLEAPVAADEREIEIKDIPIHESVVVLKSRSRLFLVLTILQPINTSSYLNMRHGALKLAHFSKLFEKRQQKNYKVFRCFIYPSTITKLPAEMISTSSKNEAN